MPDRSTPWWIAGVLCMLVFLVFMKVMRSDFVRYDDYGYVVENTHLRAGFTPASLQWAFSSLDDCLWAPMMRLSHLLDVQLFGLHAGGHHFTNLVFHVANTLLLFFFLLRATGGLWPSAAVAALFALHPLHVEPVAWVASRKDVLSTFFALLTLIAYGHWVKHSRWSTYLAVPFLFALALMSKPMVITLPCALLLLDYWPYQRLGWTSAPRRVLEKTPLFALSALVAVVTVIAEHQAIVPVEQVPLFIRLQTAVVAYAAYLGKCFFPYPLYVPYMYSPSFILAWKVLLAACLLLIITAGAFAMRRRAPEILVGWLWFLGTLVPVIGLVKFGHQVMADRFMYLPLIGVAVAVCFGLARLPGRGDVLEKALMAVAAVALTVCMVLTGIQVHYWRNTETLFRHTLTCAPANYVGHCNLGYCLMEQQKAEEAAGHFAEALRLNPNRVESLNDLGAAYLLLGRNEEALRAFQQVLERMPNDPEVLVNIGVARYLMGDLAEARKQAARALELNPASDKARKLIERIEQKPRAR